MYNRVKAYIAQNKMIEHSDHIVAGISGGADSVCLFFVLLDLQKEIPFTLEVVHVNHKLRLEAEADEAFVMDLCQTHKIPYRIFTKNIAELARQQGISIEEAGREYRYECFRETQKVAGSGKIAVAHHLNDRAETILFNLFRGSGLKGLTGIRPVRDNIIRPLLCLTRDEIEEYLKRKNIPYCTDDTNQEDIYTRNRIRQHIIPFASEVNSEAVRHMAKTADLVWEAEDFLYKQVEKAFAKCVIFSDKKISIDCVGLNEQDIFIKKRILFMAIEKLLPGRQNISACHIESLIGLTIIGGSQKINLPQGLIALKEYDTIVIKFADESPVLFQDKKANADFSYVIRKEEQGIKIPNLGEMSCRTFLYQKNENIPQKMYTKWFDYDKITSCALFRSRKPGDFLIINQKGQHKKLKEYLINEKVPKVKRDEMPVLADGSHIIWVPGLRISEYYKVTDKTETILEVKISL